MVNIGFWDAERVKMNNLETTVQELSKYSSLSQWQRPIKFNGWERERPGWSRPMQIFIERVVRLGGYGFSDSKGNQCGETH